MGMQYIPDMPAGGGPRADAAGIRERERGEAMCIQAPCSRNKRHKLEKNDEGRERERERERKKE